jgi:hypothetical protein
MGFDEKQHRLLEPASRSGCLDGPIWWIGPITIFLGLLALSIVALPVRTPSPVVPSEGDQTPGAIASSSRHFSRN